jgi:hypothetical protein
MSESTKDLIWIFVLILVFRIGWLLFTSKPFELAGWILIGLLVMLIMCIRELWTNKHKKR